MENTESKLQFLGEFKFRDKVTRNAINIELDKLPKVEGKSPVTIVLAKVQSVSNLIRIFAKYE